MSAAPLYERILGERFAALSPEVRKLHSATKCYEARGACEVVRGESWAARFLAWTAAMPGAGRDIPLHFTIEVAGGRERWTRRFGEESFSSELREHGGLLRERIGPATFEFALEVDGGALRMVLKRGWLLHVVPMPRFTMPAMATREWGEGGVYRFEVSVHWPGVGRVVEYRGRLEP